MSKQFKYPRTFHVPWSLGATNDDKILQSVDHFIGKEVIVTEKLDGENTTLYRNYIHARSLDSRHHPSKNWVKNLHGQIQYLIPEGYRICGENLFASHSIFYNELPSYFLVFGIYSDKNICLSWDETEYISQDLGLITVPVLYRGIWNEEEIKKCFTGISKFGGEQEGYVIKVAEEFHYDNFKNCVAKMVRQNHVQTDTHWMSKEIVPNRLKNE